MIRVQVDHQITLNQGLFTTNSTYVDIMKENMSLGFGFKALAACLLAWSLLRLGLPTSQAQHSAQHGHHIN